MNINIHNYEAWLLDYSEGTLPSDEIELLRSFMNKHPELGAWEENLVNLPQIPAEKVLYPAKTTLKKPVIKAYEVINENNFNDFFLSFHEGLLSTKEQEMIRQFVILNPFLKNEFGLIGKTYLYPENNIIFPDKENLKKTAWIQPSHYWYLSLAASVLFLFGIFNWFSPKKVIHREELALISIPLRPVTVSIGSIPTSENTTIITRQQYISFSKSLKNEPSSEFELLPSLTQIQSIELKMLEGSGNILLPEDNLFLQNISGKDLIAAFMPENEYIKEPSVVRRVVAHNIQRIGQLFPGKANRDIINKPQSEINNGFSFWDLAEAGVKTYNKLTDKDVLFTQAQDENGQLIGVRFRSETIEFNKELDKGIN